MFEDVPIVNRIIGIVRKNVEIIETKFKVDRFYVTIKYPDGKQTTMPRANMVWLRGNPSFKSIPKGYVIHHLDYDKTNDDISNLSLMYKFHHVSHHWKQKNIETKIDVDGGEEIDDLTKYYPTKKPHKYYHIPAKRYYVGFCQIDENGNRQRVRLWKWNGSPILTEEDADNLRDELWKYKLTG